MNITQQLHYLVGQSLWLDNITRELLTSGKLKRYIKESLITGLTSNPTIFEKALSQGGFYDESIREKGFAGKPIEDLFFELALEDLVQAADLFRPIYNATDGVDGWVSLEISPLLADDRIGTLKAAKKLYEQAQRPNVFIKIPGTRAGIIAIEEAIFSGIPINVTLLFSREHYLAAAEAYMRGIDRRLKAGLSLQVESVASLFISRWDTAVNDKVPVELRNQLGIAIGHRTYCAYQELLASSRWRRLSRAGARPQRLLFASTGVKDPTAPDNLYIEALAAHDTINTMPEKTLATFLNHGQLKKSVAPDSKEIEARLAHFNQAGIDIDLLAIQLQHQGAQSFVHSWQQLLQRIANKYALLAAADEQPC